jgi:hypothetical protein
VRVRPRPAGRMRSGARNSTRCGTDINPYCARRQRAIVSSLFRCAHDTPNRLKVLKLAVVDTGPRAPSNTAYARHVNACRTPALPRVSCDQPPYPAPGSTCKRCDPHRPEPRRHTTAQRSVRSGSSSSTSTPPAGATAVGATHFQAAAVGRSACVAVADAQTPGGCRRWDRDVTSRCDGHQSVTRKQRGLCDSITEIREIRSRSSGLWTRPFGADEQGAPRRVVGVRV